jgi:mRNA interferase MazF
MSSFDPPPAWTIIKVPYPYTDRPVRQSRPALVVAATGAEAGMALVWVLMITSAANRGWAGDVMISDIETAGLSAPSVVRTEKIATVQASDVTALGMLPRVDRATVASKVRDILAALVGQVA